MFLIFVFNYTLFFCVCGFVIFRQVVIVIKITLAFFFCLRDVRGGLKDLLDEGIAAIRVHAHNKLFFLILLVL